MNSSLFDLTNKCALITGSSRGIGWHLAKGLADAGATVIINGRNAETVESATSALIRSGLNAHAQTFDVTATREIESAIESTEQNIGPIDILLNNAGIQRRVPLLECDDETWHEVLDTNLSSAFKVARAVAARMVMRGHGKIINTCSIMSELGRPTIAPYTASKGGLKMLTQAMCAEWASHNIQVNGLGPGYFATALTEALVNDEEFNTWLCQRTPAGRWGEINELVGAAVFLAAPASNYVNGHILYVDGGLSAVV